MLFANGNKYEGEYKDNKKNGKGTYIYANGDKYKGEWKNGKKMVRELIFMQMGINVKKNI